MGGVSATSDRWGPEGAGEGGHMQEVGEGVEEVWGLLVVHSFLSKRSSVSLRCCNNFLFQNEKKKEALVMYCKNICSCDFLTFCSDPSD